jgi:hypothetical protein
MYYCRVLTASSSCISLCQILENNGLRYLYKLLTMTELDEFDQTLNSELDKLQREIDSLAKKDYN